MHLYLHASGAEVSSSRSGCSLPRFLLQLPFQNEAGGLGADPELRIREGIPEPSTLMIMKLPKASRYLAHEQSQVGLAVPQLRSQPAHSCPASTPALTIPWTSK